MIKALCEKVGVNVKRFCRNPGSGHVLMAGYIMGLKCASKENLLNVFSLFAAQELKVGGRSWGTIEQSCGSVDMGAAPPF